MPVDNDNVPVEPLALVPVLISMLPDSALAVTSGVAASMLPLVPVNVLAPLAIVTSPPRPLLTCPAFKETDPPELDSEVPATTSIVPLITIESPVIALISPVRRLLAPDWMSIKPDEPLVPEFDVAKSMEPLCLIPNPLVI